MSPHKHTKLFSGFLAFAGISAMLIAPFAKVTNTHAEGSSSYFDLAAAQCVVDNYNATTGSSVTTIEQVDFSVVTTLDCANRGITNFHGVVLFPNLENLNLVGNTSLNTSSMDFSQNTKLKQLNLYNAGQYWSLDLSNNPDIEELIIKPITGFVPYLTLHKGVEKFSDDKEYAYGVDLDNYKWFSTEHFGEGVGFDEDVYSYRLDESTNRILFEDKTNIPYSFAFVDDANDSSFYVEALRGYINYRIFFEGDEELESHNPIAINNNCMQRHPVNGPSYYSCSNVTYYGDEIDTDEIIENTLKRIFNLSSYDLSKVEILPSTASIELVTDTDTAKKGKALSAANFDINFHFTVRPISEEIPKAHNTGVGHSFANLYSQSL